MTEPQENEEARNVQESVPQTETSDPGDFQGDVRISEIKRSLFSTPFNEPNDNYVVARTGYRQPNEPPEPDQQAVTCIASRGSIGFTPHEPEENDERCVATAIRSSSRTSSTRSGYCDQPVDVVNTVFHYDTAWRTKYNQRSSSGYGSLMTEEMERLYGREQWDTAMRTEYNQRSSSGYGSLMTEEMERLYGREQCDTCKLLREICPSKETIDFWDEIEQSGSDYRRKCHYKSWSLFLMKMKTNFPYEDFVGFGNKLIVPLLKTLLNVEGIDDGEISLSRLVLVVRHFGPIKKDEEGKCILIRHLIDIVERSVVKEKGRRKEKQSWFAGCMGRDEAEKALKHEKDNTFLVRISKSGSDSGDFVLSIKDSHGILHFTIEGDPVESSKSSNLNCHLQFMGKVYDSLPSVIEDLKYYPIRDEYEDRDVHCTFVCPNLPLNSCMLPYKYTRSIFTSTKGDVESMETKKRIDEFLVFSDTSPLPRYKYHRSLLDWFMEGTVQNSLLHECPFKDCDIIIGGNVSDKIKLQLFGSKAPITNVTFSDLRKGIANQQHKELLIVYLFSGGKLLDTNTEISEILRFFNLYENGYFLYVMPNERFDEEEFESILQKETLKLKVKKINIESEIELPDEIIKEMTCILDGRLSDYLEKTRIKLLADSLGHNVKDSLFEVNAILRRLKQAAHYPAPLTEDVENISYCKKVDEIVQRFGDRILYHGYNGDILYVITTDQDVKKSLEDWHSKSGMENLQFMIIVQDKLSISELSGPGVPLHGAKFVYANGNVDAFIANKSYATTGSLMLANNNNLMVAVTCRHAVENKENFYTLIEKSVVKLGKELPQQNNNMEKLHDDIALIEIDDTTRSEINEKCEKLLLDSSDLPSIARKSSRILQRGDIVHKRGATTGLTTGIVKEVKAQKTGRFDLPSTVIYVTGRDSKPFAIEGDSGSLVFQQSLSPHEKELDVLAMVQGKIRLPFPNADVICFPFKDSCDILETRIFDIQNLQFFEG